MRGKLSSWLVIFCALQLLFSTLFSLPVLVRAIGSLDSAKDLINGDQAVTPGITHDISFVLPSDAQQVTPTDYLLVTFADFTNVTAANSTEGTYGSPIFSVSGKTAAITNVSILPGISIRITGITATNPQPHTSYGVVIRVAEDAAGTVVRNQTTTEATLGGSYITASASIISSQSSINISGFTSPSAFTSISENGNIIGTTVAGTSGSFSFPLSGFDPGNHTLSVSSVDLQSLPTSQTLISLFLTASTLTSISNILLSPTLILDNSSISPGDTLTLSGSAKPNSQINLFTESPLKSYSASTDSNGAWNFVLNSIETAHYNPGQYRTYGNIQDTAGNQSIVGLTRNFTVVSPFNQNNPPASCDISHGDLNCDSNTNLTDFSILLFHFHTDHKVADINGDGTVNLTDFSIMMFYFQR